VTTKKGHPIFGQEKVHPTEKILATPMPVWEVCDLYWEAGWAVCGLYLLASSASVAGAWFVWTVKST